MQGYNVVKFAKRNTERLSFEDVKTLKARRGKLNKTQRQARVEWN